MGPAVILDGPQEATKCYDHTDQCLNPEAVAVRWFKCVKCGRVRSEVVKKEVWT